MEAWEGQVGPERTTREVEGILDLLQPEPGSHFLDVGSGWCRHTIALALLGYEVTALDSCALHLEEGRKRAIEAGVLEKIRFVCANFWEIPRSIEVDYAINLYTSCFGYLREHEDLMGLQRVRRALEPRGKLLIDTTNLFSLVRNYRPRDWRVIEEGGLFTTKGTFDFKTGRNHTVDRIWKKGEVEEYCLSHKVFTPAELVRLLTQARFRPLGLYGDFDGREFGFDSKRIIMIAEKR